MKTSLPVKPFPIFFLMNNLQVRPLKLVTFVGSVMVRRQAPFDELKVCDYLQVFELLEQSKGVLNWVCRQ